MAGKTTKTEKKRFERVKAREYDQVEFTFPEVYGDEVFKLPSLDRMPMYIARAGTVEGINFLIRWAEESGTDRETLAAIVDLDPQEFQAFEAVWGKASPVDLPKSPKSSDSTETTEEQ